MLRLVCKQVLVHCSGQQPSPLYQAAKGAQTLLYEQVFHSLGKRWWLGAVVHMKHEKNTLGGTGT